MSRRFEEPIQPNKGKLIDPVRRRILRAAVGLSGIATFANVVMPQRAIAQKKLKTLEQVKYQPTPKGKQKCSNCDLFVKPNKCTALEGEVAAEGWCNIWVPY